MTPAEFVKSLARDFKWREALTDRQKRSIVAQVVKFSGHDRERLLDELFLRNTWGPSPADVADAATDLGLKAGRQRESRSHTWFETDCKLCAGEGRILLIRTRFQRDDGSREWRLDRIYPYSKAQDHEYKPGQFDQLARCSCEAGDAETLPSAWPKWGGRARSKHLERDEPREPKREDFEKVASIAEAARASERGLRDGELTW